VVNHNAGVLGMILHEAIPVVQGLERVGDHHKQVRGIVIRLANEWIAVQV
jgi:hypothetical protein